MLLMESYEILADNSRRRSEESWIGFCSVQVRARQDPMELRAVALQLCLPRWVPAKLEIQIIAGCCTSNQRYSTVTVEGVCEPLAAELEVVDSFDSYLKLLISTTSLIPVPRATTSCFPFNHQSNR